MSTNSRLEWRNRLASHERVEPGTDAEQRAWSKRRGGGGVTYLLGLIGALWYYVGHGSVIAGVGKALVWPAFLVYHLLSLKP